MEESNDEEKKPNKALEIAKNWRVLVLAAFIVFSIVAIGPRPFAKGALISSVDVNSTAEINGIVAGEIIKTLDGQLIETDADFVAALSSKPVGDIIELTTNKGAYSVEVADLDGENYIGISATKPRKSNLNQGLDLVGGTRVILQPAEELGEQDINDIVDIIRERLNVYGVSDVIARPTKDLEGNDYIIVELAGTSRQEASQLLSQQGKFEAKIGEEVVFSGGEDITYVCRSADCSGISFSRGCGQTQDGSWACNFQFLINLAPEAARRQAEITKDIPVTSDGYLEESIDLYLDDNLVDSLLIAESLKGSEATSITIQGPGFGPTREAAVEDALNQMKGFQTVLITGSLPVKLEVVKMDIVSPTLGETFLTSALIALLAALLAVGAVVFIRYRKLSLAAPILVTGLSEVLIILGFAALIRWNLDLAALAGILAAVGTGVDDQLVITDEALRGEKLAKNWKQRMKNAFFIIMAAYFTTVVAMLPLWWMGAGLIRGFALTTIAGVTFGVLITRPAYAKVIEILLRKD